MKFRSILVLLACGLTPAAAWVVKTRASARSSVVQFNSVPLTANGKRVEVAAGSSMIAACNKLGLKVPTNCKKGDCGTCTVNVGGKNVRACIGKVPPAPRLKSVLEKGLPVKLA
eukprot:CAMPEP_0172584198 /NCGR_PEP_ID=MMETSP1068-20121228/3779_1 /TAXON_ID=35684 /ORGANISM="Pseudopedinella elastica, Strain CCMP716" /LENGTH=113 /DNA_ID=CAMNT_0013378291 /DNA_START=80 /DNA_END=421 /DNA_ORIENTATION=+